MAAAQGREPVADRDPTGRELAEFDEVTLVLRTQDGDLAAYDELVRRYQDPLFRHALRILHDRGAAEDQVQEALIALWRRASTLRDPQAFRAWIYRLLTHRCLDQLRRRREIESLDAESAAEPVIDGGSGRDPADQVEVSVQLDALSAAVDRLGVDVRVCWTLREIDGLSYAEIAEVVGATVSTVRGRIARARSELLEGMSSWR